MSGKLKFCDIICYKTNNIKHPKYCICIDPVRKFFLFINTRPDIKNPDGDIPVKPIRELSFLDYDSYINTSYLERIYEINIEWLDYKGKLSESLIEELGEVFLSNHLIYNKNKKDFWKNLNNDLKRKLEQYRPKSLPIPKINQSNQ